MKTDSQLKRDVMAELAWDPAINSDAVGVAAENGVVTITGHVDTFAEKFAIERALRRVQGVRAIALEIDVKLSLRHRRNDTELALAIEEAVRCNTAVSLDKLQVTVENGWVTLAGVVDWEYQRRSIESVVRPLIGVVGISNKISLRPRTTPDDVADRIKEALQRQVERESKEIHVDIAGSTVTLKGAGPQLERARSRNRSRLVRSGCPVGRESTADHRPPLTVAPSAKKMLGFVAPNAMATPTAS